MKLTVFLLLISLFFNFTAYAVGYYYDGSFHEYTAEPITLKVNGEVVEGDMPPILLNDRTMVPAVFVFGSLDANVSWISKTRQVKINYNNNLILLTIDSRKVLLNDEVVYIDENDPPAKIINDRTMIPVRFVSEQLGLSVSWNSKTRTVSIDSPEPTEKPTAKPTAKPIAKPTTKPTERPTAAPTERPTIAPANGYITSVTYKDNVVTLKGKGLSDYKTFTLEEPNRYIFDFYDVAFKNKDQNIRYEDDLVKELRYATHNGYARLVLETEEQLSYTYKGSDTVFKITIDADEELPTEKPTAKPSNQPVTDPVKPTKEPADPTETPAPTPKPTYAPREQNEQPIVVLDAGHGGTDPGALGRDENGEIVAMEKDINLAVTLKVYDLLCDAGIDTYLTREDDTYVSLGERSRYANSLNADLFVSIHSNAIENTTTNGMMVMHNPNSADDPNPYYFTYSKELAEVILKHMKEDLDFKNLGLRDGADLWVIRKTSMPAVLIELAFITNESDREKLTDEDYQDIMAEAIFKGIMESLENAT